VKEAVAHGELGRFRRSRLDVAWRVEIVAHGFGHAPEDEANAHAGRKEHAEPAEIGEAGLFMVSAELDLAVATEGHVQAEDKEQEA